MLEAFRQNNDLLAEESGQVWIYHDGSEWTFRVRSIVVVALYAFHMPMRHATLRYEFMQRRQNLSPTALGGSGQCVVKQCAVHLLEMPETLERDLGIDARWASVQI